MLLARNNEICTIFALKRASVGGRTLKPAKRYRFSKEPRAKFFNLMSPNNPCQLNKFRNNFTAMANWRWKKGCFVSKDLKITKQCNSYAESNKEIQYTCLKQNKHLLLS